MKEVRKRGAVPKEETWAVEDLYPSNEACLEAARSVLRRCWGKIQQL